MNSPSAKILIDKNQFIQSNLLVLTKDVACIFCCFANSGLQGHLLKLDYEEHLSTNEQLSILIGRSACIPEQWNYGTFTATDWAKLFPSNEGSLNGHLLTSYSKTPRQEFLNQYQKFKDYFIEKTNLEKEAAKELNLTSSGPIHLDGKNTEVIAQMAKPMQHIQNNHFLEIPASAIKNCYANIENWNWQIWYIETQKYSILFQVTITS